MPSSIARINLPIVLIAALLGFSGCNRPGGATSNSSPPANDSQVTSESDATNLHQRLKTLCDGSLGEIGVAVMQVESGQMVAVAGGEKLPLYSVFKLPLAIAVLKGVEENRISLDKKIRVTPEDVAPGSQFNTDLWREPVEKTVAELLELSIVRSDNTSSDKLMELAGGPGAVTERMRAFGFSNIDIVNTVRGFTDHRENPNTGTAEDLALLLARLQRGDLLQQAQVSLLLGFMERARTGGERRLRANLPADTQVADKTGSGDDATNDVGLITLPGNQGHLAIAVLISGSKLSIDKQEKLIAEVARTAYDAYVSKATSATH